MFGKVEDGFDKDGVRTLRVMGVVDLKHTAEHELTLEWDASASNDMIADSTLTLITGIDTSLASVKLTSQPCAHAHPHADSKNESSYTRIQILAEFLENHFGEVELHMPDASGEDQHDHEQDEDANRDPALILRVDEADAHINLVTLVVTCTSETLRKRIETVLDMAVSTISSLTELFKSSAPMMNEEGAVEKAMQKHPSRQLPEDELTVSVESETKPPPQDTATPSESETTAEVA